MDEPAGWTSRAQLIACEIGTDIINGKFTPGMTLPREAELTQRYDVSRNTLREAMKALSAKALLEIAPRRGTLVLPKARWNMLDKDVIDWIGPALWTDKAFLTEILVMRAAIEPVAAAEAAIHAADAQKSAIEAAFEAMAALARSANIAVKVEVDLVWHVAVAAAANNRFLVAVMTGMAHALVSQLRMLNAREGNYEGNLENHSTVTKAIRAGDAGTARRFMQHLVDQARHDTEDAFRVTERPTGT